MVSMPATIGGDTYKYIMCVIDIFSRLPFSLLLETKEKSEVEEFSFAFHMYDAKSLDHRTSFDGQYMIVLCNFKRRHTLNIHKYCNQFNIFLFMYTVMSVLLTTRIKPGL